jgi:hypothetical protein
LHARTSQRRRSQKNPLRIQRKESSRGVGVFIRATKLRFKEFAEKKPAKAEALEKLKFSQVTEEGVQGAQEGATAAVIYGSKIPTSMGSEGVAHGLTSGGGAHEEDLSEPSDLESDH